MAALAGTEDLDAGARGKGMSDATPDAKFSVMLFVFFALVFVTGVGIGFLVTALIAALR